MLTHISKWNIVFKKFCFLKIAAGINCSFKYKDSIQILTLRKHETRKYLAFLASKITELQTIIWLSKESCQLLLWGIPSVSHWHYLILIQFHTCSYHVQRNHLRLGWVSCLLVVVLHSEGQLPSSHSDIPYQISAISAGLPGVSLAHRLSGGWTPPCSSPLLKANPGVSATLLHYSEFSWVIVNLLRFSPAVAMKPKLAVNVKKKEGMKNYFAYVSLPAWRTD